MQLISQRWRKATPPPPPSPSIPPTLHRNQPNTKNGTRVLVRANMINSHVPRTATHRSSGPSVPCVRSMAARHVHRGVHNDYDDVRRAVACRRRRRRPCRRAHASSASCVRPSQTHQASQPERPAGGGLAFSIFHPNPPVPPSTPRLRRPKSDDRFSSVALDLIIINVYISVRDPLAHPALPYASAA